MIVSTIVILSKPMNFDRVGLMKRRSPTLPQHRQLSHRHLNISPQVAFALPTSKGPVFSGLCS